MKTKVLVTIFAAIVAVRLSTAASEIQIGREAEQEFKGWGVVVSDELVVELVANRNYTKKGLAVTGLKPDFVSVGIRFDFYDNERDNGGLNSDKIGKVLFPKVKMLTDAGVKSYLTFEDGVPPAFTRYGKANTFDCEVAPEREGDHIGYLIKVFEALRKAGLPLPMAHSVQVPAEQSILRALGQSLYGDHWREAGAGIAQRFQSSFGTSLRLIGPDAQNFDDSVARILGPATATGTLPTAGSIPDGFALGFSNSGAGQPEAQNLERFRLICAAAAKQGTPIWMTGWFASEASTERAACLAAAQLSY